ncbi:oxidoreductase family protein [Paraglaciecola sp. 2405UD69-4]|uniref:oxidoreductase family protein n=1 Tax=Paraglaciecola sp. 2405UD69-4 TaxID=3391836 RepID=UPI0039C93A05
MLSNSPLLDKLQQYFADDGLVKTEVVQTLWSGYGEITRFYSPKKRISLIVKCISPPAQLEHPRGWNTQSSHNRKLQSYQIESHFYRDYQSQCDDLCRVPQFLTGFNLGAEHVIVLEDLDAAYFSIRKASVTLQDVYLGVKWLAHFHGRFLGNSGHGLWPIGCYWHLGTRKDEFIKMEEGKLKQKAQQIDNLLNQAEFQTLVHGDAKVANFCFPDDGQSNTLAAVDFQYVGRGIGVKDLAYFLGGCLDQQELLKYENKLLALYFEELGKACLHYQVAVDISAVEAQWRELYPLAWADFHRFLLGWAPEHFKINTYMQRQTDLALSRLA